MNRHRKGFSLVEIMVGMAMGMIAMIVIMQVFTVFEADKRTTTGGSDAQTNGAVALFMIERDTKIAGWGMDSKVYRDCNTTFSYCDGSSTCGGVVGPVSTFAIASVILGDGGTGPDTITSQYFTDPTQANFSFPGSTKLNGNMASPSDVLNVQSLSGCKPSALALIKNSGTCTLVRLTPLLPTDDPNKALLRHEPTPAGDYNPPADYMTANGWPAYARGSDVACFTGGAESPMTSRSYSVDANRQLLLETDVVASVASDIMDLQAEYGILPVGTTDIQWVAPTGAWANPTMENRALIKAIRIALVARSTQYEKPESGTCATTTTEMVDKWSSWATFDTSGYPSNWQCYRYKVFETVVPLRNIISGDE